MTELDLYDDMPREMRAYLRQYGWNFNKRACDFAVELMRTSKGKIERKSKEDVKKMLAKNGVELKNDNGYNSTYVYHMALADFWGSSIEDEAHLCKFVKDVIDDEDNKGGNVMRKWYADMTARGIAVDWGDLL